MDSLLVVEYNLDVQTWTLEFSSRSQKWDKTQDQWIPSVDILLPKRRM
jgi:hypothetical protein